MEKYDNTIWDKVSADIKREFDSEPFGKKFLKTNIKFYWDEATDFHDKEIPKVGPNLICLALIKLDSAPNEDGNYYQQAFLKESSIVIEIIRTVYYYHYYFLSRYFAQKNTQALFKYLNTLKKHNKEHKQLSFRCKAMNFCSNICLKKYSWHKM